MSIKQSYFLFLELLAIARALVEVDKPSISCLSYLSDFDSIFLSDHFLRINLIKSPFGHYTSRIVFSKVFSCK